MSFDSSSVPIRAGHLDGSAFWDPQLQSYGAQLRLFDSLDDSLHDAPNGSACDPSHLYPPPFTRYGTRQGEFVTVDALTNHLTGVGLALDGQSLTSLQDLVQRVERRWGHSEIVGLTALEPRYRLFLVHPNRNAVELHPPIDHPDYGFGWGRDGSSTEETARTIVDRSFGRTGLEEGATFALTLAVEFLSSVSGDFSLNVNSLCDWYLAEAPLVTHYAEADRRSLRRRLGLDGGSCSVAGSAGLPVAAIR